MSRLYVYAVIRAGDQRTVELPPVCGTGSGVFCIPLGSIAVVVSATEEEEILSTRRNMLSHTKILEELNRDHPILPFRFGLVAAGRDSLVAILKKREAELARALEDLVDVIEVGLKVSFVEAEIFREIVAETPELRQRSAALRQRPPAETYYERIELGRLVSQRVAARKQTLATTIAARFGGFARKAILHPTPDDMCVFDAAYLVARASEPALFAELERFEKDMQGRFLIRYVAPTPPYNFVSMRLDALPMAA